MHKRVCLWKQLCRDHVLGGTCRSPRGLRELKMGRTIYRFYCYRCMREHKSTESFLLERSDKKIKKIYCPGCRAWVPVEDTNLSPDRFRLIHIDGWCFVGNLVDYDVQSMQERMEKYQIHFRIGDLAYDRNGKQLSDRYHPIFIHSDDMQKYDQMMRNNP